MRPFDPSPEGVRRMVDQVRRYVGNAVRAAADAELSRQWDSQQRQLSKIVEAAAKPPRLCIALVGSTGAGKSTLINALLGQRLLPTLGHGACTAAIAEVAYAPGPDYCLAVEFVRKQDWDRELDLLRGDLEDGRDGLTELTEPARQKIRAVYGIDQSVALSKVDLASLQLPAKTADWLGWGRLECKTDDTKKLAGWLKQYLSTEGSYWPLVRQVRLSGPFDALQGSASLVDLPGLNDPNPAREAVTHEYLKTCSFVWVVCNIKRGLTKEIRDLMAGESFYRQLLMDGLDSRLTFVCTHSDDIDASHAVDYGLARDALEGEVVKARNSLVRSEQLPDALRDLAEKTAAPAGGSPGPKAAQRLLSAKTYTVSALEYLRLSESPPRPKVLSSVDETEIPQLREHLAGLCRQDGLEAHCRAQLARVGEVAEQVMRFVDERKLQVEWQRNATREQAEAAKRQLDAARSFRDKQVSQISDDLREHLRSAATRLGEQLSRAIERAEGDRQHLRTAWDGKHWATLRAAARWGADGLPFCGSTGRHDFARDATAAMLNKLMVPWADHFEDKLTGCLDEATRRLCDLASGIWDRLRTALQPLAAASPSDTEDIDRYLRNMVPDLEFHLGQSREQATKDIAEVRRSAYERLPREVRERMKPAFRAAAEERGLGMKQRMVDKIFRRLDEDFDRCMEEVEVQIVQEARQLNDGLQRRFDKMKSGFVTQSDRAFERFGTTSAGKSEAELKDRERRLDEALQHLAQLDLD